MIKNPLALSAAILVAITALAGAAQSSELTSHPGSDLRHRVHRVLLISVDGMHQADLARWIARNPGSNLAQLSEHATTYTAARAPTPSDSFPGMLAMVTGGTPKSTGVYYDDSYDRTLYAPGSNCTGNPGIEAAFDEFIDNDTNKLFSGGINPAYLPMEKGRSGHCSPVYPHSFLKTNTVFEVIKHVGGRTAWSDKHPAYELLNGPSGTGVDDLYTPEINSLITNGGTVNGVNLSGSLALCNGTTNSLPLNKVKDYTNCIPTVEAYDDVKVKAIINEIDGLNSTGTAYVSVPTIFGMNFQEVSVGQKLPVGGYADASGTPSANLKTIFAHLDHSIGQITNELQFRNLQNSTLIIISAKHGQSPINRGSLAMESGGRGDTSVQDPSGYIGLADPTVDSASSFTNPNSGGALSTGGHLQTDDVGLVWLQNQSPSNVANVVAQLKNNAISLHANQLSAGTVFSKSINVGSDLTGIYGDPTSTHTLAFARAPNIVIQPNAGVIYSGSSKKIAEHGGGTVDDTGVALMVSLPSLRESSVRSPVSTTQIAPTILRALHLNANRLDAVRLEKTLMLPGL